MQERPLRNPQVDGGLVALVRCAAKIAGLGFEVLHSLFKVSDVFAQGTLHRVILRMKP